MELGLRLETKSLFEYIQPGKRSVQHSCFSVQYYLKFRFRFLLHCVAHLLKWGEGNTFTACYSLLFLKSQLLKEGSFSTNSASTVRFHF